mgnify:CR=1 FL=1
MINRIRDIRKEKHLTLADVAALRRQGRPCGADRLGGAQPPPVLLGGALLLGPQRLLPEQVRLALAQLLLVARDRGQVARLRRRGIGGEEFHRIDAHLSPPG